MSDSSDAWLTLRGYRTVLEVGPADPAARHRPDDPPFRLSDFDLLREVGRGGMGVVYEAVQRSLGRRVAVKVLTRAALLDDSARRRFQHEARVAAFVPHPNVVPVFHAGEEDGVPFFVMPLISGTSLAGVLDAARDDPAACRLPRPGSADYFAGVARLAADAARALQAAHEQGVIHRDVKPANILLDDAGKVWVTDFGLALAAFSDGLTRTGDRPGTVRYMSPEQLTGPRDRLDGRTDVYSLGVTLYELATLHPMFDGGSEQPLGRPVRDRPAPPRALCPAVPEDLETVILKATADEPADRYPTARALADDLDRFAAGEPILARRLGAARKLGRWAGRHRWAGAVAAAVVVALFALVQVLTWRAYRAEADARAAAERNRQLALAALANLGNASDQILAHSSDLQVRHLPFLLRLRDEVEPFAADGTLPAAVRRDIAWVHYRIAECHIRGHRWADAGAEFRLLADRLEPLVAAEPDEWTLRRDLGIAYRSVGTAALSLGRPDEAVEWFGRALPHAERANELRPDAATALVALTELRLSTALLRERLSGQPGTATPVLRAAVPVYESLRDRYRDGHPKSYMRLADLWGLLARQHAEVGDWEAADRAYVEAVGYDDHLIKHFSAEPANIRESTWQLRGERGRLLIGRGKLAEGLPLLRDAVRDLDRGVALYPGVVRLRATLAEFLASLALAERLSGRDADARATAKRCAAQLAAVDVACDPAGTARAWAFLPDAERPAGIGEALIAGHRTALPPWLQGAVLIRLGRADDALAACGADPSPHAHFLRVICLAKLGGDAKTALECATRALAAATLRDLELRSLEREADGSLAPHASR